MDGKQYIFHNLPLLSQFLQPYQMYFRQAETQRCEQLAKPKKASFSRKPRTLNSD